MTSALRTVESRWAITKTVRPRIRSSIPCSIRCSVRVSILPVSYTHLDVYKRQNVTSDGYIYLQLSWSEASQNIAGNYTNINWNLRLISTGHGANIVSSAAKSCTIKFNGTTVFNGTVNIGLSAGQTKTLRSGSNFRINHNSDGKKTFSYSFSPVSYTHLDVYKRQPVALSSEDNVFRVHEYTINSAPSKGEAPYTLSYVEALPTVGTDVGV